jgi:DNA primase large subunit
VTISPAKWFFKRDGTDRTDLRIKKMLEMVAANANLAHSARFALTSFLLCINMFVDQVVGLFNTSPDFDQEKNLLSGGAYRWPSGTKYKALRCFR